jgi:hypothetical protein
MRQIQSGPFAYRKKVIKLELLILLLSVCQALPTKIVECCSAY